jgi:hypothetical protein
MKKYLNIFWIFFRILKEFQTPSTRIGKKFFKFLNFFKINKVRLIKSEILICFYDLNAAPTTFNFSEFIVLCNNEILIRKLDGYKIVFIKKKNNLINKYTQDKKYHEVHDKESEKWKFDNIIIPLISFTKFCVGYDIIENDEEINEYLNYQNRFPEKYSKNFRINLDNYDLYNNIKDLNRIGLVLPNQASKYVENYITKNFDKKKKIITITFRTQKYDEIRNSNLDDWLKIAEFLKTENFEVIIIPDTDEAYSLDHKFRNFNIYHECAFNLPLRMGIYCNAFFNYFAGGGPSSLCTLHKSNKYIMFNYGPIVGSIVHTDDSFKRFKKQPLDKFKFAKENQILVWEKDTYENILKSYNKYILEKD